MGGGTGTGGAPVIAQLAREMGILTVGIVTTPFRFEGKKRQAQAAEGIAALERCVDTIVIINNDNLTHIFGNSVTMKRAFEEADQVLCNAARGIAEIITLEGYINVDFADVQTIMKDGGTALMGTATCEGEDRAIRAAEEAISSPLLDNINIHGSKGILLNITASPDSLRLDETTTIVEYIQEASGSNADIIFGTVYDDSLGDKISVTVIATGFRKRASEPEVKEKNTLADQPVSKKIEEPEIKEEFERTFEWEIEMSSPEPENFSIESYTQPDLFSDLSEGEDEKKRKSEKLLSERMEKLKSSDYDYHNPSKLSELEQKPAYERNKVNLEPEEPATPKYSHLSMEEISEDRFILSDTNSFLHDNVD
jgi:cell division protein FtsZ